MAKHTSPKIGGVARIRFVVIDAELPDGDIGSVTQVIQNALKGPTTVIHRRAEVPDGPKTISHQGDPPEVDETSEELEAFEAPAPESKPSKQKSARKPAASPDVIDIDMDTDVGFAAFTKGKDAKSQHKKYLIAAAWLKEHRDVGAVSANHIYTCFRSVGWPTNIADFGQPLRQLKSRKFFSKGDKGEYEINHLGQDYVRKLGGTDGTE